MRFFLRISKKSSTFAADFEKYRRDVGIGRQERLKIFCPVMGVPVRPRLAVPKQNESKPKGTFNSKIISI